MKVTIKIDAEKVADLVNFLVLFGIEKSILNSDGLSDLIISFAYYLTEAVQEGKIEPIDEHSVKYVLFAAQTIRPILALEEALFEREQGSFRPDNQDTKKFMDDLRKNDHIPVRLINSLAREGRITELNINEAYHFLREVASGKKKVRTIGDIGRWEISTYILPEMMKLLVWSRKDVDR